MVGTASLIKKNYDTQVCTIAASDPTVIPDLPTTTRGGIGVLAKNPAFYYAIAMGSVCICQNSNRIDKYILFSEGWVKSTFSSGGSGANENGSGANENNTDYDIATDDEIKNIFNI